MAITHLDSELIVKIMREHATFVGHELNIDDFTILGFSEGNMAMLSKDGKSAIVLENNIKDIQEVVDDKNNITGIVIVCNTNNSNDPEYEIITILNVGPEEIVITQQKKLDGNTIKFFKKEQK